MRRLGIYIVCLFSLSGCSALDALKAVNPLKEDKGISATVQAGRENHSDSSKQLVKSNVDSSEHNLVQGNQTVTKTTNVPWWTAALLLFVRPMVILKETMGLFKLWRKK